MATIALSACTDAPCSDDAQRERALQALGVDDGASKGEFASETVTGKKDVQLALNTGARLEVPQGAVGKTVGIGLERPADSKAKVLVDRFKRNQERILSAPYVLTPHGTKFTKEVALTLPLAKKPSRDVTVAWLADENDTEWKELVVTKTNGREVEVVLKHFSVVVLVDDASDLASMPDIGDESDAATDVEEMDGGVSVVDSGDGDAASAMLDAAQPPVDASVSVDSAPLEAGPNVGPDAAPNQMGDAGPAYAIEGLWVGTGMLTYCGPVCSTPVGTTHVDSILISASSPTTFTGTYSESGQVFASVTGSLSGSNLTMTHDILGDGSWGSCAGALSGNEMVLNCSTWLGPEYGANAGALNSSWVDRLVKQATGADAGASPDAGNSLDAGTHAWAGVWRGGQVGVSAWTQITADCSGGIAYLDACGATGTGSVEQNGSYRLSGTGCSGEVWEDRGFLVRISDTVIEVRGESSVNGGAWTSWNSGPSALVQTVSCSAI